MARRTRLGFTIVELLVVISIVVLLMGLLLPAIQVARETARRTQCSSNMRQLAQAALEYETARGNLPPSRTYSPATKVRIGMGDPTNVNNSIYGWPITLLDSLGEGSLSTRIEQIDRGGANPTVATEIVRPVRIFVCPSDATSLNADAPLSYACNNGMENVYNSNPADWPENGAMDDRTGNMGYNALTSRADIVNADGVSNTIMFTENVVTNSWLDASSELKMGVIWDATMLTNNAFNLPLNSNRINPTVDTNNAQPSSFHSKGFNVAMADTSVRFVSDKISYNVYARLLSSNGQKVWPAGYTRSMAPPGSWAAVQTIQRTALSSNDF